MKRYSWIIVLISIVPFMLNAHGNDIDGGRHMMDSWNTTNPFWWIIIPLAFVLVIFLIKVVSKSGKKHSDATEILKNRYAKGEISKEEFDQMKEYLK